MLLSDCDPASISKKTAKQLYSVCEELVSSYILLLAVIQLPAVRGQLIPVLQQLGDKFMEPMKLANQKMEMYFENEGELLLENDFRKLIRDALPAAQEIMKIQPKSSNNDDSGNNSGVIEDPVSEQPNETPSSLAPTPTPPQSPSPTPPPPSPAAKKAKLPKPLQKAKDAKRSKSDLPRSTTPDAAAANKSSGDFEKLKNENRSLTSENLELNSEIKKIHTQLDEYESECRHYKDELKTLSRQLDHLESENERLRERPKPSPALTPSAKPNVFDQSDTSESDDEVQRLKQEIKSHESKASHTKIALGNLEKSISTYHDKLEVLEGQCIDYRQQISDLHVTIQTGNNELGSKQNKISQLEEIIRQSRQTSNYDSQASESKINQLESERDELLENSSQNLDQIRLLEDKIHKLETVVEQQNQFIEQNETELNQRNQVEGEVQKLNRKILEMKNAFAKESSDKNDFIAKIEEQLEYKRNALKEKNNLVDELKEIVNENKESNYEFTSIISHQRQDIESLRKLLEDNNIEIPIMKNGFDYKSDRQRISSADSSTPTVVEGQDIAEGKDIDSSHLQKPIHADVLLRIESTTSESSNTEKVNDESKILKNIEEIKPTKSPTKNLEQVSQKSTEQNLNLIDDAESMEIIGDNKTETTSRITSDDEEMFSHS
jgi:DNA repair exonuclease SbcCD ATPase subunit